VCVRVATDKHTLCNVLLAAYELRGRLSAHCTIWTHSNGPGPKKGTRAVLLPPMGAAGRCCVRVALLS
jgi:hypothetical protein